MIVGATIYLGGLAYILGSGSAMARDPKRFWPALVGWPFVLTFGAVNSLLNRL